MSTKGKQATYCHGRFKGGPWDGQRKRLAWPAPRTIVALDISTGTWCTYVLKSSAGPGRSALYEVIAERGAAAGAHRRGER